MEAKTFQPLTSSYVLFVQLEVMHFSSIQFAADGVHLRICVAVLAKMLYRQLLLTRHAW